MPWVNGRRVYVFMGKIIECVGPWYGKLKLTVVCAWYGLNHEMDTD